MAICEYEHVAVMPDGSRDEFVCAVPAAYVIVCDGVMVLSCVDHVPTPIDVADDAVRWGGRPMEVHGLC